jgi:hypothetical protein
MNDSVFRGILAMDAYNHGNLTGINELKDQLIIGNAVVRASIPFAYVNRRWLR